MSCCERIISKFKDHERLILTLFVCFMVVALLPGMEANARQEGLLIGSHGDRSVMPKGCRACHKGMNIALGGEEGVCFDCHSDASTREQAVAKGSLKKLGNNSFADISAELRKPYNHPVLSVSGVHRRFEDLPETVVNAARHAECVDCHNPHATEKDKPYQGLRKRREGNFMVDISEEYELCYRCHSESANLPGGSTNKHAEFKSTNRSFHPVEAEGRSTYVVSLKEPYVAVKNRPNDISRISCSDCHGSDDPASPKGPHGSSYAGLLVLNYQMVDEFPESAYTYALCYKCHNRTSIMSDESFPYHSLHIQGRMMGLDGTSCFTCHDAHGSVRYQHLIRFNESIVSENANGDLEYDARGAAARHGSCSLNCHGVEHDAREY